MQFKRHGCVATKNSTLLSKDLFIIEIINLNKLCINFKKNNHRNHRTIKAKLKEPKVSTFSPCLLQDFVPNQSEKESIIFTRNIFFFTLIIAFIVGGVFFHSKCFCLNLLRFTISCSGYPYLTNSPWSNFPPVQVNCSSAWMQFLLNIKRSVKKKISYFKFHLFFRFAKTQDWKREMIIHRIILTSFELDFVVTVLWGCLFFFFLFSTTTLYEKTLKALADISKFLEVCFIIFLSVFIFKVVVVVVAVFLFAYLNQYKRRLFSFHGFLFFLILFVRLFFLPGCNVLDRIFTFLCISVEFVSFLFLWNHIVSQDAWYVTYGIWTSVLFK